MKAVKLNSGAIFQVPLINNYGYAYVKLINFEESGNVLVKPLNFYSKTSMDDSADVFSNIDYTSAPYLLLGNIKSKGKNSWKHIGDLPLMPEDFISPELKRCFKIFISYTKDPKMLDWNVVKNFNPVDYYSANFEDIKHLGMFMHTNSEFIGNCLSILWMLRNGEQTDNHINNDELKESENWDLVNFMVKMVV